MKVDEIFCGTCKIFSWSCLEHIKTPNTSSMTCFFTVTYQIVPMREQWMMGKCSIPGVSLGEIVMIFFLVFAVQEIFGYKTQDCRKALCIAGYILSCGALLLLFYWKPEWDVWANCIRCSLEEADVLLLRTTVSAYSKD